MVNASARDYPAEYFLASALAATINYPLWRASAIGQSGFVVARSSLPQVIAPYVHAISPPYKGALATILGMTWARGAIFWGSDAGRDALRKLKTHDTVASLLPPLVVSTLVQCINMPLVRATITIQNPESSLSNVRSAMSHIYKKHGLAGLWHGTSAGVLKTVPKYCTAVVVKDLLDDRLPQVDPMSSTADSDRLWRSASKSAGAGIAGAALTNGFDVIRNEMFKTNKYLVTTVKHLWNTTGYSFLVRGLGKNLVAVSIPVGTTIFFTDAFIHFSSTR